MKFTRTPPTEEGFYWCYLKDPNGPGKPSLETGQVRRCSNGYLRTVAGAFDFDWAGWLYWGDKIEQPTVIELNNE